MEEKPEPSAHPLESLNFRDGRSLFLDDWATTVQPNLDAGHAYIGHSVTYGSTALQAGYIINGGALGALPLLIGPLTKAGTGAIALAAIPFVLGIAATAVSSVAAYLNFQWWAHLSWFDGDANAANLKRFYQRSEENYPDPARRASLSKRIQLTFYIGVGAGIASLIFFIVGAVGFIALVRHGGN